MASFLKFSFALMISGFVGASAFAQAEKPQVIVIPPSSGLSCPVAMQAQHGVDGSMRTVNDGAHRGIGQQLELTLKNQSKRAAVSAIRIIVYGWNANGRALPAGMTNSSVGNASRKLDIKLTIHPGATAGTDVWVSGLTSVDSIELAGVRYADGSRWKAPASRACRIVPDPEMLISRR